MIKKIIRSVALILNFGIIVFILGLALNENLEFDNLNTHVFITIAMFTPLLNISGLIRKPAFIKPLIALIVNTVVLVIFLFIILLVMIWPMGSKPHGMEVVYIFSLYSSLLFIEISHVLNIKKPT